MTLHSSNDTTIVSNLIIGKLSTEQRPGWITIVSESNSWYALVYSNIYFILQRLRIIARERQTDKAYYVMKLNLGWRYKWDNDEHVLK